MKKWILCLVVGISLLLLSTGAAGKDGVRCDGDLMQPGDICEYHSRTGEVTSRETYDEVKADNEAAHQTFVTWGRWALLGGGLALSALGIWGITVQRRRRRNQGPTTADLYFQQQAAQSGPPAYPPQQQYAPPQQQQTPQQQAPQYPPPQYPPQQYPQQPVPPRPPQPQGAPPPAGHQDFGPGSGEDVTQRLR
jgi:hypothetical protein